MSVLIRLSRDSDVAAITAIYARSVETGTASWEYDPPTEAQMRERRRAIIEQQYPYIVAELAGEVVGYAYASSFRTRIGYRHTVEDSVYVAESALGRGIGRALLEDLIARCIVAGFRQMIAVIGDSTNAASMRLHAACGFVHVGTFRSIGEKFGRELDSVQMQRDLRDEVRTSVD